MNIFLQKSFYLALKHRSSTTIIIQRALGAMPTRLNEKREGSDVKRFGRQLRLYQADHDTDIAHRRFPAMDRFKALQCVTQKRGIANIAPVHTHQHS